MSHNFSCPAYLEKRCASCSALSDPTNLYLKKFLLLKNSLERQFPDAEYCEPEILENPFNSRAKAKLQVGGSIKNPQIGLDRTDGKRFYISPLLDCPLHTTGINPILVTLKRLITKYLLVPYSIEQRNGELKGVIVLETNLGIGVRFVSRSRNLEDSYGAAAKELILENPTIKFVSLNIQPIPHQIVEGDEEHILIGEEFLRQDYDGFFILLPPLSFIQVTPEIAKALYRTAKVWLANRSERKILDLFCGAGGFLLSLATLCKVGSGIELKEDSVLCANQAAKLQGYKQLNFVSGDLNTLKITDSFDTIIVNPPRRGLGRELIEVLRNLKPKQILYSSCNPETLFSDIAQLEYLPKKFKAFDMFPLTEHLEVLALLDEGF